MGATISKIFGCKRGDQTFISQPAPSVLKGAYSAADAPAEVPGEPVPVYVKPSSAPTTVGTAVSVVRELLETMRNASNRFLSFIAALDLFLKVWDVYESQRAAKLCDDFIELASKLAALNTLVASNKTLDETNLQKRLEATAVAINQLAESMQENQDQGTLSKASQSMGDVTVVKIMFRRAILLLEVFQFDNQIRAEALLVHILERLNTSEQHDVTNVDAVQVILAHMDEQHSTNEERYQAILHQLRLAGNNETVINNNSKRNELDGPADLENNNSNETELEIEGRGGGIVNNNSNVNRVTGGGASSSGSGSPGGDGTRTRITNNNGNKSVVRRIFRKRKANPKGPTEQQ